MFIIFTVFYYSCYSHVSGLAVGAKFKFSETGDKHGSGMHDGQNQGKPPGDCRTREIAGETMKTEAKPDSVYVDGNATQRKLFSGVDGKYDFDPWWRP